MENKTMKFSSVLAIACIVLLASGCGHEETSADPSRDYTFVKSMIITTNATVIYP